MLLNLQGSSLPMRTNHCTKGGYFLNIFYPQSFSASPDNIVAPKSNNFYVGKFIPYLNRILEK